MVDFQEVKLTTMDELLVNTEEKLKWYWIKMLPLLKVNIS